jgi:Pin2-interacting protein X1
MKTHLKVEQKLDMMGIGAQHQRDPNGIAWKQNKEFEALLKRLNEGAEQGKRADGDDAEQDRVRVLETTMGKAFVRAQEGKVEGKLGNESRVSNKKRKHEDGDDPDESTRKKAKEKKEKRQKSSPDDTLTPAIDPTPEPSSAPTSSKPHSEPIPKSRPMA